MGGGGEEEECFFLLFFFVLAVDVDTLLQLEQTNRHETNFFLKKRKSHNNSRKDRDTRAKSSREYHLREIEEKRTFLSLLCHHYEAFRRERERERGRVHLIIVKFCD